MMLKYAPEHERQLDAIAVLIHHLETGNDVIRIGAIRALAHQTSDTENDSRIRDTLLKAIRDEDPKVRAAAMEAFVQYNAKAETL